MADDHDYHVTNHYVLFGHDFAAIAEAGPLYWVGFLLPSLDTPPRSPLDNYWSSDRSAAHDMVSLFTSVRYQGRSLPLIAEKEIGSTSGIVSSFAVLFILISALAGLSISVVNSLFDSPWVYSLSFSLCLLLCSWALHTCYRVGDVKGGSILGVIL